MIILLVKRFITISVLVFALNMTTRAVSCEITDNLMGYTIVVSKTIVAKIDDGVREDGFTGCEYGRIIVFSDETGVKCSSYGYQYAYRPDAILLTNGSSIKMCVGSELYDVGQIR